MKKVSLELIYLKKAYDIKHCIYCGRSDFVNFAAVLDHVKKEHKEHDD